jgi:lipopolysaccharide transport system permease protein
LNFYIAIRNKKFYVWQKYFGLNTGSKNNEWTEVITPGRGLLDFKLKEVWRYRDLVWIFVIRDFTSVYKQTILGPLWFFIGPVLTILTYTVVFSGIAKIPTSPIPGPLFYLTGTTLWNYFQQCFTTSSSTFVSNAGLFGKVYFPRLCAPVSAIISNLIKFSIQILLLSIMLLYYAIVKDFTITVSPYLLLFPFLVFLMAGIGLGVGIIVSALTTKYRDFQVLINFGISLLMFASPVVYPLSSVPPKYQNILLYNPITPVIETFRLSLFGQGELMAGWLVYSFVFMLVSLLLGIIIFNQVEKNFMDTV